MTFVLKERGVFAVYKKSSFLCVENEENLLLKKEEDLIALKLAGVIPVVLPGASLGLGIDFAPARKARILQLVHRHDAAQVLLRCCVAFR